MSRLRPPASSLRPRPGLVLLALLAGCGWRAGLAPPPGPLGGAQSVAVEIFDTNRDRVLERDLEPLLHRELSRALSDLVEAPLAAPETADLVIRGRIVEFRRRSGVRRPNVPYQLSGGGKPFPSRRDVLENAVQIVASAELVDRRTGVVVHPATTASIWSGYAVNKDDERNARDRALRNVAETLILELFAPASPVPASPAKGAGDRGEAR